MSRHLHFLVMPNLWFLSKNKTRIKTSGNNFSWVYWLMKVYAVCYSCTFILLKSKWYHGSSTCVLAVIWINSSVLNFSQAKKALQSQFVCLFVCLFRNEHVWRCTICLDHARGLLLEKSKSLRQAKINTWISWTEWETRIKPLHTIFCLSHGASQPFVLVAGEELCKLFMFHAVFVGL